MPQIITYLAFAILQNECAKANRELQEQNKYTERLRQKLDDATQFHMKTDKGTKQNLAITSSAVEVVEAKDAAIEVFVGFCVNFFIPLYCIMLGHHLVLYPVVVNDTWCLNLVWWFCLQLQPPQKHWRKIKYYLLR